MVENKLTSEENQDLRLDNEVNEEGGLNFRIIYTSLILYWQWFLLSLIVFLCGAFLYLRYVEPVYEVSSRMLVKNEDRRRNANQMLGNIRDLGFLNNSTGIDNEMEVLQSRVLLREVVKDLKIYTEYRKVGRMRSTIMYNNQPFNLDLDPLHLDSLDYLLLEMNKSTKMTVTRENESYIINGKVLIKGEETSSFVKRVKTMPASFKTEIGTITMTENVGRKPMDKEDVYEVTIRPPMLVATSLLNRMSVAPTSKLTSVAEISLRDKNVRRGLDVLRQLTICYNEQANADKNEVALRTEEFINERMTRINKELGSTEGEIESFKRQNSITNLGDAAQSVQMSNEFSARLSEANSQVQMLDYLRDYVNNSDNKYQVIPSNVGLADGAANGLIDNYNKAVQDRNRLLKAASEQAPQVQTLTATIDEMQSAIKTALLQARRSADINRQGIQSQFNKFQGRVSAAPVQERVLAQVGRQQDVKSSLYMLLLQKREENSIELAATADNGKLIDEPQLNGKVSPKPMIILLGALLMGFLVPGLVIWVMSLLRYKIEGHDDVARLTNMPIIADIPVASEDVKKKANIVVQENKNSQIDEIFRSLRTNIQFMLKGDEKVVLFTSTTAGEGKTFIAANLAVSFALLGKKVILCGLDIRKPALGRLFDVSDRTKGFTSMLSADKVTDASLADAIIPSNVNSNLDLLLAGPVPPNPTELLSRDSFAQIVKKLREQYDYIIFDTAPVGLVTDTRQIGLFADVSVFVCRADYTPKSSFNFLNTISQEKKMPNTCVVINGVDMSKRKYGYYYGYGRYGKFGRYGAYGRYGSQGSYGTYGQYGQYADSHYGDKDDHSIKK